MNETHPPLLLALDTATSLASVALFDGEQVLLESTWLAGRGHAAQLLVEVERAFTRLGRARTELTGVVVAVGPGSFTGVRVALSVAKGISAALAVPAWGVETLDILAHAAGPIDLPVRPVLDAGRGRVATALYREGQRVEPMHGVRLTELRSLIEEPTVLIGDLPPEVRMHLTAQTPARLCTPAASLRRAGHLAALGWEAFQRGDRGDPAALDAVYLAG